MVVFLSTGMLKELSEELMAGGYPSDTPAAIVYKATWPEEKTVRTTVAGLAEAAERENITKSSPDRSRKCSGTKWLRQVKTV